MKMLIMLGALSPVQMALALLLILCLLSIGPLVLGSVFIRERQVGIVVKKFGRRSLPPGRLVALAGESGYQADTLPPGLHFGYFRWQYRIIKMPVTVVPQGEIALVVVADGASIPSERILGKVVDCDNFQDARKFLLNGGEKGRQLGILTAGTYRINKALFNVITSITAPEHGMGAGQLVLQRVGQLQAGKQCSQVLGRQDLLLFDDHPVARRIPGAKCHTRARGADLDEPVCTRHSPGPPRRPRPLFRLRDLPDFLVVDPIVGSVQSPI